MKLVRHLILVVAVAALMPLEASANGWGLFKKKSKDCDPCAPSCDPCATAPCDPCGPAPAPAPAPAPVMQKIKVTEMRPTWVEETHTVMKPVQVQEEVTVMKKEMVPVTETKKVTAYRHETCTVQEPRTTTVKVPVWEDKVVMESRKVQKQVVEYKKKTVDNGHWVCEEKPVCFPGLHKKDPCDPCAVPTRTVKKWVSCKQEVCEPVCKTVCVTECVPVCKKVCTYKCETKTEMVSVCKTRCVPYETTCTVTTCKEVCTPVKTTVCKTVCQPVQEKVKVCKMVAVEVEKEVCMPAPCAAPCAPTPCCK